MTASTTAETTSILTIAAGHGAWPTARSGRNAERKLAGFTPAALQEALGAHLETPYAGRNSEGHIWANVVYAIACELALQDGATLEQAWQGAHDRLASERDGRS